MSANFASIGRKLRECRTNLKITIEEAAEFVGSSAERYNNFEEGKLNPTGDDIVLLSKLYVQDFRYFVTNDFNSAEKQVKALFRQNETLSKNDRIAIQKLVRICEYKYFFEELLGVTKKVLPNYSLNNIKSNYKNQGIRTAYLERKRLNLQGPINNIFLLLRNQNLNTFRRTMDDGNISGVYINHSNAGHCVLVNYLEDIYRQNFSAAHEYAHALFDSTSEQSISYIQSRISDPREWRANYFASHFLVPEDELSKFRKPNDYDSLVKTIIDICNYFKVNRHVIIYRLKDLKWYTKKTEEQLLMEHRLIIPKTAKEDPELRNLSIGFREKLEPMIKSGLSYEYIDLVRRVYQDGLVTYGKMIESLLLPYEIGKDLMHQYLVFLEV